MKTLLVAAVLAVLGVSPVHAGPPETYVSVTRVTAGGALAKLLAFQNTSSASDVVVRKIEVSNASTVTVTGGIMQFWVYGSTSLTHSVTTTADAWTYSDVLGSAPSFISVSTAPSAIQIEGDSGILTTAASNNLSGQMPLIRPLVVNNDEAATANLFDSWTSDAVDARPIVLPAGANRALVFEQRQVGGTDYSAGSLFFRITYTLK